MYLISTKWERTLMILKRETTECVYFHEIEKYEVTFLNYIFYFISTKWKIFHQYFFFFFHEMEKTKMILFISLYFCFYLQELENISSSVLFPRI